MDITLPTTTVSEISANVSSLIADLSGVITLIIGILLALFVISYLVGIMRGNDGS